MGHRERYGSQLRLGDDMSTLFFEKSSSVALTGSMRDFRVPGGSDLLARGDAFFKWQDVPAGPILRRLVVQYKQWMVGVR